MIIDDFWIGFWSATIMNLVLMVLLGIFFSSSELESRTFVVKYCIEKQVKEACEILGDSYGK